jgi:ATP-binding cassette, subfamily B, bacterial
MKGDGATARKPGFAGSRRVFRYLGARTRQFFTGVILVSVIMSASAVLRALLLKGIMNAAVSGLWKDLAIGGTALAVVLFVNAILHPSLWKMFMVCYPLSGADLRQGTMGKVQRLPLRFFETGHSGDVISRINSDIEAMLSIFGVRFRRFITPLIHGLFISVAMLALDWRVACALIAFNALSAALNLFFAAPMRTLSARIQKITGVLSGRAIDMLSGISCVKVFPIRERILADYGVENDDLADCQARRSLMDGGLAAMNAFLVFAGNIGVILAGFYLVWKGRMDLGTMVAFSSLQNDMGTAFHDAAEYFPTVQRSLAGADRIFELIDQPAESERLDYGAAERGPAPAVALGAAEIELRDIRYSYVDGAEVLRGVSLSIAPGQVVALVGESGGGKSTLLKLILGFYKAQSGSIRIRGKGYSEYSLAEIRDLCAWVPQENYLFDGTIRENIGFGRTGATEEEIARAARNANALGFIEGLKDGFDTQVGQAGIKLSGGQRQRITIARALLRDAPILLLDEATSNLDSSSEQLVQDALARLMRGRTSIVVAHRLSTIRHADVIHVMEKGRIIESGSHEELLESQRSYFRLWSRLQQEAK